MGRIISKRSIFILLLICFICSSFVAAANTEKSTAETETYILGITDITEIKELTGPSENEEAINVPLYILPKGATISLTAKTDGLIQKIQYYNEYNQVVDSFSMNTDGKKTANKSEPLTSQTTVYYTVTDKDSEYSFMSINIFDGDSSLIYYFKVADSDMIEKEDEIELIVTAEPTESTIYIDGVEQQFQAYKINDHNYFKLRDIAQVFSGTKKEFEVEWDEEMNAISLYSGKPYTPQGGELNISDDKVNQTGMACLSIIYLNGEQINLVAYEIDDLNYFKLRDLGEALDFAVVWDMDTESISIITDKGYWD